jgi:hypothetical protein
MPTFYVVDGFKVYSHLDAETTEKFFHEIQVQGLLPQNHDRNRYATHHKIIYEGSNWSVAILHTEKTIFIDKIYEERFNPRKV